MAKGIIDKYFLEARCPYTKRRPVNLKALAWTGGTITALFIVAVLFVGGVPEKNESGKPLDLTIQNTPTTNQSIGQNSPQKAGFGSSLFGLSLGGSRGGSGGREHSSNQVILRGAGGNDPSAGIPVGSGIQARLVNAVLSTSNASPVIAEITEDVLSHNVLSIPALTRAIGSASYDEASHRIQLSFTTFVYPEGDEHSVSGLGLLSDGSAGLTGDYHSEETKRQFGRFLGNFIGGLADGMKDRTSGGQYGIPIEPGSIKNGLLNGVTLSAEDQAKIYSENLTRSKPYMTLQPGQSFIIYLEKEYVP